MEASLGKTQESVSIPRFKGTLSQTYLVNDFINLISSRHIIS